LKKLFVLMFVLLLALSGCGSNLGTNNEQNNNNENNSGSSDEANTEPIVFKFATELKEGTPQVKGVNKFKELVEEKSDGQMEVEIYHSGQLGSEKEVMQMIQTGGVETGLITTAVLGNLAPVFQVVDLPFLFPNRETVYHVLDGEIGDEILGQLDGTGIKGAAFFESGFKQMTANKEIKTPEDLEGLKFRTMESPIIMDTYEALGATPVPIAFAEVYNALQQGVVDGQENPLSSITTMKFYEVQDHLMLTNHSYLGYGVVFGKGWFDGLSADLQEVLISSAKEAAVFEREAVKADEEGFLKEIKSSGTKVHEFDQSDLKPFVEATKSVQNKYADIVGKDILDSINNAVAEFQK
jgi:tripartite ATP-independent transporter DctP family solute receptor